MEASLCAAALHSCATQPRDVNVWPGAAFWQGLGLQFLVLVLILCIIVAVLLSCTEFGGEGGERRVYKENHGELPLHCLCVMHGVVLQHTGF